VEEPGAPPRDRADEDRERQVLRRVGDLYGQVRGPAHPQAGHRRDPAQPVRGGAVRADLADGTARHGAARRGYLLKERVADGDELAAAIPRVTEGGSVIDPTVIEGLVAADRAKSSELDSLTPREVEVLGQMAQGKSNTSIAAALVLSERAIEKHTNSIFSKLGLSEERDLNRRVSAVLVYLQNR
jgi:DNA-binding NarL/FixJ family response regulator